MTIACATHHRSRNGFESVLRLGASAVVVALASSLGAQAMEPLFARPIALSEAPESGVDGEAAAKSKLARLIYPSAAGFAKPLIAAYADGVGAEVWGFDDSLHAAADIFVTRSTDSGLTWSAPINVSNTALLSSIAVDHDGVAATPPVPYAGDTEKPNLVANGKRILITWVSRYCPSGRQRTVRYAEAGGVEVPYGCLWSTRSSDGGLHWTPAESMTDGFRDAKQDLGRGSSAGFAVTLQQDPRGLQPGDAEGPGDGGSGAKVSHGTDIWWTALKSAAFDLGTPFPPLQRLTDNYTRVDSAGYESGTSGASRAGLVLEGGTALVAYEETKGSEGDSGKVVRFHAFSAFDDSQPDLTAGAGCIVSQAGENARRARIVVQPGAFQASSSLRLLIFWRQGLLGQGGPADIVARVGRVDAADAASTGLRSVDLWPAVTANCTELVSAADNDAPLNLSSSEGLDATTAANPFEDARAHRAVVRGDTIALGWTWTPEWEIARSTALANYNFHVRRSIDAGSTWGAAQNVSKIDNPKWTVREPRLVAPPASPDPSDRSDPNVLFAAWSTEINLPEGSEAEATGLDIRVTRSVTMGITWEPTSNLAAGPEEQTEAQLASDPQGTRLFGVWQERDKADPGIEAMFRSASYPGIFADDFELGDLSAWTTSSP